MLISSDLGIIFSNVILFIWIKFKRKFFSQSPITLKLVKIITVFLKIVDTSWLKNINLVKVDAVSDFTHIQIEIGVHLFCCYVFQLNFRVVGRDRDQSLDLFFDILKKNQCWLIWKVSWGRVVYNSNAIFCARIVCYWLRSRLLSLKGWSNSHSGHLGQKVSI